MGKNEQKMLSSSYFSIPSRGSSRRNILETANRCNRNKGNYSIITKTYDTAQYYICELLVPIGVTGDKTVDLSLLSVLRRYSVESWPYSLFMVHL